MRIPIWQVDAFSSQVFRGNPAAVCPLDAWLDDGVLQAIAAENNLSETAFLLRREPDWEIRWFTPVTEVRLCGHATLASAFVLFEALQPETDRVTFHSRSGPLTVRRSGDLLVMDFPARRSLPCPASAGLTVALGRDPLEVLRSEEDTMAVLGSEAEVRDLRPDIPRLASLVARGLIVTAPGNSADFVSRFFAPGAGIPEDPVTGSAHCTLTPFWAARLGKRNLRALQVSRRGGELFCEDRGDRVAIAGRAVCYLEGAIYV